MPIASSEPVITETEIERALLASIEALPIEDWMAFISPDQAKLARRSFNGPSRIRGAAGTGKTVVGLHRAAYLARTQPGKVLVTTLVRTLPTVLSSLMQRMAPDVADRVEFVGIHSFANGLLRARGIPVNINDRASDYAFDAAWEQVGAHGVLGDIDPNIHYWKEEVLSVIKGRGLTRFLQYAELARAGRRRGLSVGEPQGGVGAVQRVLREPARGGHQRFRRHHPSGREVAARESARWLLCGHRG